MHLLYLTIPILSLAHRNKLCSPGSTHDIFYCKTEQWNHIQCRWKKNRVIMIELGGLGLLNKWGCQTVWKWDIAAEHGLPRKKGEPRGRLYLVRAGGTENISGEAIDPPPPPPRPSRAGRSVRFRLPWILESPSILGSTPNFRLLIGSFQLSSFNEGLKRPNLCVVGYPLPRLLTHIWPAQFFFF